MLRPRDSPADFYDLVTCSPRRTSAFFSFAICNSTMFAIKRCSSRNVNAGQLLFNNACRTCHTVKEGDNRLGPNLYNILGRKAGSVPNYAYSSAMRSADFVWDKETFDRFIENPDTVVPGNKMKPYDGLASAARAKVISFLESLTNGQ